MPPPAASPPVKAPSCPPLHRPTPHRALPKPHFPPQIAVVTHSSFVHYLLTNYGHTASTHVLGGLHRWQGALGARAKPRGGRRVMAGGTTPVSARFAKPSRPLFTTPPKPGPRAKTQQKQHRNPPPGGLKTRSCGLWWWQTRGRRPTPRTRPTSPVRAAARPPARPRPPGLCQPRALFTASRTGLLSLRAAGAAPFARAAKRNRSDVDHRHRHRHRHAAGFASRVVEGPEV